jgi:hypothetical protein
LGTGECKIPGGVGEARWDVCMMHTKVLRREGEQEQNDRGREKAKEVRERERDIRGCEGGKGGMKDRNNGMKDRRTV